MAQRLEYLTHDNGGRPFKVTIDGDVVRVYKNTQEGSEDVYDTTPFLTIGSPSIFVGKSPRIPMTEFSGGHGPLFDGNSILVEGTLPLSYIFIGSTVFTIKALHPIREFVSPVGNNDVPYPYAVDIDGNYYLLIEDAMLKSKPTLGDDIKKYGDPYSYYYKMNLMTPDEGCIPPRMPVLKWGKVKDWFVGEERYTMRYHPNPAADYDRIIGWNEGEMWYVNSVDIECEMSKEKYIELNDEFGKLAGFEPLQRMETIYKRI